MSKSIQSACVPFFCHHQQTLNKDAFSDLRPDALEQSWKPFVFDEVRHDFPEGLERFTLSRRWRTRLENNFSNNQRLGYYGCQGFGCCAEN